MIMKTGKLPAVKDDRIPRMSVVTGGTLPPPPVTSNWYAEITGYWGMLLNDELGCCVPAAIMHSILQMSAYAGQPLYPTNDDVLTAYEAAGYVPGNPTTDLGSYVMGTDGLVPYWHTHGFMCGGVLNKVGMVMQITKPDPIEWRQAISLFGGILVGFKCPERIVRDLPYVWMDSTNPGPIAGGHEIWINGYQPASGSMILTGSGPALYDIVSWGKRYRATEQFLLTNVDEVVAIVNPVEMNARGLNAADYNLTQLESSMRLLT